VTPPPAPAATARAGQTALLWRLGLLALLVVAVLVPPPVQVGVWLAWGAAALAALLAALRDSPASPAPLPMAEARAAPPDPPASPLAVPAARAGLVALPWLVLVGLLVYGGVAGPILLARNIVLAGSLAAPLVAVSLAVLLPGHDTAAAARSWALAVGAALWAALGTVAIAELAGVHVGSIPALVPLVLALAAWSAVRRAVRMQGMGGRWPEALGTGVGLTAIVMTTTLGVAQLLLGFVVGVLLAQEADRFLPPAPRSGVLALISAELVSVQHQLVFAASLVLLALAVFPAVSR
jgi:hypothetical protein